MSKKIKIENNNNNMLSTTIGKLKQSNTLLLVCDVQDRFRGIIHEFDSVVNTTKYLLDASNEFNLPVIFTEQYPKALKHTVKELEIEKLKNYQVFEKTKFSMMTNEVNDFIKNYENDNNTKIENFIITGLETHVCVLQTCLDLVEQGKNVHVVIDAVSSQRITDRSVAIERLKRMGCFLTTSESVLFMLLGDKNNPNFKAISNLSKNYGSNPSKLGYSQL